MSKKDGIRLKTYIRQNKGVSLRQIHARGIFRDCNLGKQKKGKGGGKCDQDGSRHIKEVAKTFAKRTGAALMGSMYM